jgi:hypothetical protein
VRRQSPLGRNLAFACIVALGGLAGCKSAPESFLETRDQTWTSLEVRDDLKYDQVWESVADRLIKQFDMEIIQKQDGYCRTAWNYAFTGKMDKNYRVRVTAKFSGDRTRLDFKSEAEYGGEEHWQPGTDTVLIQNLKTDLIGLVGRASR